MRIPLLLLLVSLPVCAAEPDVESLMINGHWKRARALAGRVIGDKPNDARANYWMACVRRQFKLLEDAEKYAAAAVRLDPQDSAYHRELAQVYFDRIETASIVSAIGLAKRCRGELDTALKLSPNAPAVLYDQILFYQQVPGMAGGDKRRAAQLADTLVRLDPARGYLAMAYIARQERQPDRLGGLYQKAVEANPRDYDAQIGLGSNQLTGQTPNPKNAEAHALAALALNSDRVDGYRLLAAALVGQKRYGDAAAALRRAETTVTDDLSPYVSAARALLREGAEMPTAETWLQKYLHDSGEPEPTAPPLAAAHWSLGRVYEKLGRLPDARRELETAVRLKPDFEPARRDLKRLK